MKITITGAGVDLALLEPALPALTHVAYEPTSGIDQSAAPALQLSMKAPAKDALGELVRRLVELAGRQGARRLVVETENGRLEVPIALPPQLLAGFVARLEDLDSERLDIRLA